MLAKPRTAGRLLSRCLSGALGQTLTTSDLPANPSEWEKVLRYSSAHLVVPQLRWALLEKGLLSRLPADVAEYLDAVYTLNLDRNLRCEEQLADLIKILNSIDVRPVLLKGAAAIVGGLYPTSGERIISDLDIVIPAEKLREILDKLSGEGYQLQLPEGQEAPDPVGFCTSHHYPPVVNPNWPARVELHLCPVHLQFVEILSSEEVYREATGLMWRGGQCLLPSPTHFVTHNIIHAFLHDSKTDLKRVSLRQLFEFTLSSREYDQRIDWKEIRNRFESVSRGSALRQYVVIANTCLGFPVPNAICIDDCDRLSIKLYLVRLYSDSRATLLIISLVNQLRLHWRTQRRNPGRVVRKIFTISPYKNFLENVRDSSRN